MQNKMRQLWATDAGSRCRDELSFGVEGAAYDGVEGASGRGLRIED